MTQDRLPPLNSLRGFNAAAHHMSFRKAAEELHVTPAALSYQIRQLEDHLGVKLFRRLNKAVELTEDGKLIAPGIRESFDQLTRTLRRLKHRRSGKMLVISSGPAFIAKWLAPRLYRFTAAHPDIEARISAGLNLVDLEYDDVDVAIRFGQGEYPNCCSDKLFDDFQTPLCSPALLQGEFPLRKPQDLAHHTLIHDDTHMGVLKIATWSDWLTAAGAPEVDTSAKGVHFNVADHALDAAISGGGVVLGRTVLAQADIDAGRLVMPFELKLKTDFAFYVVSLESRFNDPIIKAFRTWLFEEAAGKICTATPGPAV